MSATRADFRRLFLGLGVVLAAMLGFVGGAEAHRLKLFLTAEDGAITGYAFFVGGGRPEGVDFVVKDAGGAVVHRGNTDDQGNFRWRPATAADYAVTVDAGDGHWVEGGIAADRLATARASQPITAAAPAAAVMPVSTAVGAASEPVCPAPLDAAALAEIVEAKVDRAVARQLRPLIEAQTQAEGRLRFNDVMGGIGMIVGLAGAGLWATARRRRNGDET